MGTGSIKRQTLAEAKEAGFTFRFYLGDEERLVPAEKVEISAEGVTFSVEDEDHQYPFHEVSVQIFPQSKAANVIVTKFRYRVLVLALLPLMVAGLLYTFAEVLHGPLGTSEDFLEGFSLALVMAAYAAMFATQFYFVKVRRQREIRAASSAAPLITGLTYASDVEEYFSRLIQVNLKNMDQYYLLVRNQTEKSYRLTQVVAVVGFVVLVAGILLSFSEGLESAPTVVTIASGSLIEFISVIFFYILNRTVRQLNSYHDKLVNVQDTMLALKVAQVIEDKKLKDSTMAYLTRALTGRFRQAGATSLDQEDLTEQQA